MPAHTGVINPSHKLHLCIIPVIPAGIHHRSYFSFPNRWIRPNLTLMLKAELRNSKPHIDAHGLLTQMLQAIRCLTEPLLSTCSFPAHCKGTNLLIMPSPIEVTIRAPD